MAEITRTENWKRPYFTKPVQGNLLYFAVYAQNLGEFNIDGEDYRVYHMPEGISLTASSADSDPETLNMFREGIFAELLQEQHPSLVKPIAEATHCYIVQALVPDAANLNDLKSIIGVTTYLNDAKSIALFDPLTLTWWKPTEWRKQVFEPEAFDPFAHVKILVSPEHNESVWVHTRGMRKFGRPDLSVHYVTEEEFDAVKEMVNRFIGFMALGGEIAEGQDIKMEALPEGMTCHHKGNMEDPDFNNVHVEITWPDPDA